jgi:hypothetical protein
MLARSVLRAVPDVDDDSEHSPRRTEASSDQRLVISNGALANIKLGCDLLVREATCKELGHLTLS